MWQTPWLVLILIACGSTYAWAVADRRVTTMTALSAGVWALLAIGSANISYYTETGTKLTYTPQFSQYVFGFLAIISFLALWAVVWWGELPTAERNTQEAP